VAERNLAGERRRPRPHEHPFAVKAIVVDAR
jgi:hypothetical protein